MKVKELIKELQKFDGQLRVFASVDMMDVYYGEIIGVDVNDIQVNCIKKKKQNLNLQKLLGSM